MKEDGMPLLIIYVPQLIGKLNKMLDLWTSMAKKNGLPGIKYMYQNVSACVDKHWDRSRFSYGIQFNPQYVQYENGSALSRQWMSLIIRYSRKIKGAFGIKRGLALNVKRSQVKTVDYDKDWNNILTLRPETPNMIPSAMIDWDNTPRKKEAGWCYRGASPQKFKMYFSKLVERAINIYHTDKIFVFAWNEWAEGGYLEPDEKYGFGYLEAIRDILIEYNQK